MIKSIGFVVAMEILLEMLISKWITSFLPICLFEFANDSNTEGKERFYFLRVFRQILKINGYKNQYFALSLGVGLYLFITC